MSWLIDGFVGVEIPCTGSCEVTFYLRIGLEAG